MVYRNYSSFSHSVWWTQVKMHSRINFYHTSDIGEESNVVIKNEQANLAQLALDFKAMINIIERHAFYQGKSKKLIMFEKTHKSCILLSA